MNNSSFYGIGTEQRKIYTDFSFRQMLLQGWIADVVIV